ncbi:unnamed protein product [Urochloa decumbens]|uniref:TFIIS N-terminal domain-containing protein n=1 Tax=Urochloa decumbens TaxID=240449 RepID=A0ABC8Z2S4_9POAL
MADHHHPLRRWKPFLAAFAEIDAAIEAAGPGISRAEFRRARCAIVEQLCDTTDDDEGEEEAAGELLCRCLDGAMAEALLTLRVVPVAPATLATTELVPAVRALMKRHECECVRALARDVVCGWRAAAERDLARVREAVDRLDQIVLPAERTPPAPADTGDDGVSHSDLGANTKAAGS